MSTRQRRPFPRLKHIVLSFSAVIAVIAVANAGGYLDSGDENTGEDVNIQAVEAVPPIESHQASQDQPAVAHNTTELLETLSRVGGRTAENDQPRDTNIGQVNLSVSLSAFGQTEDSTPSSGPNTADEPYSAGNTADAKSPSATDAQPTSDPETDEQPVEDQTESSLPNPATTSKPEITVADQSASPTTSKATTSTTASPQTTTTTTTSSTTSTSAAPVTSTTVPGKTTVPGNPDNNDAKRSLLFYGMEWTADPRAGDVERAIELGVDTIMVDFDGADPDRWRRQLDEANRLGIKVVANYWNGQPAWTRTGNGWSIRSDSRLFVETVADHPALLAVYLLHEPYWNGGDEIGTELQRDLYRQVKAIADVPLYSAFSWSAFEQKKFVAGICDYCDTWFYPSEFNNDYNGAELDRKLETILNHFNTATASSPDTKLVWILQAFESSRAGKQLPTYDEMIKLASTAIQYQSSSGQQVDAVFWYTWRHGSEYEQVLGGHPELQPAVREVRDRFVR